MPPNNNQEQQRQLSLYHPSRWYSARWENPTLLSELDKNHNIQMAPFSSERRLQNSISSITNTVEVETDPPDYQRSSCSRRSCPEIFECTNYRIITIPAYWFPLEFSHHTRNQQTSTYFRLPNDQSVHTMSPFQNERGSSTPRHTGRERLHVQIGPQGCLCGYIYSSRIQEIPNISTQRQGIPIQDIGIRDERQSQSLQQTNEICDGTYEETRNSISILLRRYMHLGEDEDGSCKAYYDSSITFRESGFCDKQRKEYINTFKTTRFSRIHVQFEDNDHFSPKQEISQDYHESESSDERFNRKIMSMDRQLAGENDIGYTSNWGSTFTHKVFTTGSSEKPASEPSAMGCKLQLIDSEQTGTPMVEDMEPTKKRLTNTEGSSHTRSSYSRRRVQFRMGRSFKPRQYSRTMERRRTITIHQRSRIKNNFVCTPITRSKISWKRYKNLYRQHHRVKVRNKVRRNFISYLTRSRSRNTRTLQSISAPDRIPAHSGDSEYSSRQAQSSLPTKTTTFVRSTTNQETF